MNWSQIEYKPVKLGDTATFINGYPFKPTDWSGEGLPIIRIQNLTGNAYESNFFSGKIADKYFVQDGDILISWSASLGIYEWYGGKAWLNQHIFKVVFDKTEIDKIFFKFLILEKLEEMKSMVHGATMKHITKGKFDNLDVKIPSLEVQQQIAALLDRADTLRQLDRQLLTHYDTLIQSVFLEMFGDPVKNEKGWEVKKLGELCNKITDGTHKTPNYQPEGVKFISAKNIKRGTIDWSDLKFITKEEHYQLFKRCNPEYGDIVITKSGSIGMAAIVKENFEFSLFESLALLKLNNQLINIFFRELINSNNLVDQFVKGVGIKHLHLTDIRNLNIPVPPLALQQRFAAIVEKIEAQKATAAAQAEASEALFQSLLQKAFGSK